MVNEKMLIKHLKELEQSQDYAGMISELKKYESVATQAYLQLSSIIMNPHILGVLKALEEMSVTSTTLLRYCLDLLNQEALVQPIVGDTTPSSTISVTQEKVREFEIARGDTFSIIELEKLVKEYPILESSDKGQNIDLKFWYIQGGQNESIVLNVLEKEHFGKVLLRVLNELKVTGDEIFSISALGYDALLQHQFESSISNISKTYGKEFTLIKLFK